METSRRLRTRKKGHLSTEKSRKRRGNSGARSVARTGGKNRRTLKHFIEAKIRPPGPHTTSSK